MPFPKNTAAGAEQLCNYVRLMKGAYLSRHLGWRSIGSAVRQRLSRLSTLNWWEFPLHSGFPWDNLKACGQLIDELEELFPANAMSVMSSIAHIQWIHTPFWLSLCWNDPARGQWGYVKESKADCWHVESKQVFNKNLLRHWSCTLSSFADDSNATLMA